jgi:hypothetical protein
MRRLLALAVVFGAAALALMASSQATRSGPYSVDRESPVDVKFSKPANNTWYTCASLEVPAGTWRLSYRVVAYSSRPKTDTGTVSAITTLSSVQGVQTDKRFTSMARVGGNSYRLVATESASEVVTLAEDTTFYLMLSQSEGGNWDSLQCLGASWSPTRIRAEAV